MSWFNDNKSQVEIGLDGESKIRKLFIDKKIPFMQVDAMFFYKGKWCLAEIKTQEKYLSPPFDGHGLSKWQIDRRLDFYKATGIIPYLIVNCLTDNCIYIANLVELYNTKYFYTKGLKPRVIFNLDFFKKV